MGWTSRQQQAIEDTENNLLVSAAAGSGKTSVLVERIKNLISQKGIDINSMLIVTFTKAAAGEMKSRLRSSLGIDVSQADICTYDSFAQKIIRNYYHIIGLNPKLKICDSYKKSILENDSIDELFKSLYELKDEEFLDFLNHYASPKSDANAREMVLSLFSYVDTLPNPKEFLNKLKDEKLYDSNFLLKQSAEIAVEILSESFNSCNLLAKFLEDNDMPLLANKVKENALLIQDIIELFNKSRYDDAILKLSDLSLNALRTNKAESEIKKNHEEKISYLNDKCIKAGIKKAKDLCDGLSFDVLEEELKVIKKPLTELITLTLSFMDIFESKKLKEGLMDFSDGSHYALKILENENVCKELREKYAYIFVDEYQDSNAVQEELIQRICRNNNLFMVGDVKQSIYKFRHAEPELFLDKYAKYQKGQEFSKLIDLNDNFRSKPWVINCVNQIFKNVMTKDSCYIEYDDNAALKEGDPKYTGELKADPKLYLLSSESDVDDDEIDNLKNIELEALMCVEIIKEHLGQPYFDKKAGVTKNLNYKDMVILLRKLKGTAETFYQALSNAGIPVYMQRNEGYFNTPEVEILINLLKLIDNIKQDIPLISVLHFPSFGFSTKDLADIRIYGKEHDMAKASFYEIFKNFSENGNCQLSERCQLFLEKIKSWKLKQTACSLADFIWQLMFESNIYYFVSALRDSDQRLANIRAFVDKASSFEKSNSSNLFSFINYIGIIGDENARVSTGQSKIINENDNVVRIMTIHSSKGLEFPFVLVSTLGSKLKGQDSKKQVLCNKDMGASIVLHNPKNFTKFNPKSFNIIKSKQEKDEHAEAIRVLYVAATRAKDFLYFSAVCKNQDAYKEKKDSMLLKCGSAATYLDMVYPCMNEKDVVYFDKNKLQLPSMQAIREDDLSKALEFGFDLDESKLSITKDELKSRIEYKYRDTEIEMQKRKYSVSEIAAIENASDRQYVQEKTYTVPAFLADDKKLDSSEIGTAYHLLMEHIPFTLENKSSEDIRLFIDELKEQNILNEDQAVAINPERVSKFFDTDVAKLVCESKNIRKEASFVLKTNYDNRQVLVQGTIDCYAEYDDGLILLDYKSNYVNKSKMDEEKLRLQKEYKPQLDLYKKALQNINGKTVKKAYLYLFNIGEFVEL